MEMTRSLSPITTARKEMKGMVHMLMSASFQLSTKRTTAIATPRRRK